VGQSDGTVVVPGVNRLGARSAAGDGPLCVGVERGRGSVVFGRRDALIIAVSWSFQMSFAWCVHRQGGHASPYEKLASRTVYSPGIRAVHVEVWQQFS
jgi:hypothetical protein